MGEEQAGGTEACDTRYPRKVQIFSVFYRIHFFLVFIGLLFKQTKKYTNKSMLAQCMFIIIKTE